MTFFCLHRFRTVSLEFRLVIDQDNKYPSARLRSPREWGDRVPLVEGYTLILAIPRKDEFSTKSRTAIDNMHMEE